LNYLKEAIRANVIHTPVNESDFLKYMEERKPQAPFGYGTYQKLKEQIILTPNFSPYITPRLRGLLVHLGTESADTVRNTAIEIMNAINENRPYEIQIPANANSAYPDGKKVTIRNISDLRELAAEFKPFAQLYITHNLGLPPEVGSQVMQQPQAQVYAKMLCSLGLIETAFRQNGIMPGASKEILEDCQEPLLRNKISKMVSGNLSALAQENGMTEFMRQINAMSYDTFNNVKNRSMEIKRKLDSGEMKIGDVPSNQVPWVNGFNFIAREISAGRMSGFSAETLFRLKEFIPRSK
jgi:hypothetical protein